jgi:hypothetical protein
MSPKILKFSSQLMRYGIKEPNWEGVSPKFTGKFVVVIVAVGTALKGTFHVIQLFE